MVLTATRDGHVESSTVVSTAKTIGSLVMKHHLIPNLLRDKVNDALAKVPGYSASVDRIDVHAFAGKINLFGVRVGKKISRENSQGILDIAEVRIDIQWKSLWSRRLIASVEIDAPHFRWDATQFAPVLNPRPSAERRKTVRAPWHSWVNAFPFRLDKVVIKDGHASLVRIPGQGDDPIDVSDIFILLKNLTNSSSLSTSLTATAECHAQVMADGRLHARVEGQPLTEQPALTGTLEVRGVRLQQWQNLFKQHLGMHIMGGTLDFLAEAEVAQGQVRGYVKPVVDGLRVKPLSSTSLGLRIRAMVAEWLTKLLRNENADRVATRIRFQGSIDDPKVFVLSTLTDFLKNAFQAAFTARLEHQIFFAPFRRAWSDPEVTYGSEPTTSALRRIPSMLKTTCVRWKSDNAPRMAAALAYYTAFSIAPLLLLVIAVVGILLGHDAARGRLVDQLGQLIGPDSAKTVETMVAASWKPSSGVIGTIISIVMLLVGATGVLSELKDGLNVVWHTTEPGGLGSILKARARYVGLILGIGFLMIVSLVVSAALAASTQWINARLPFSAEMLIMVNAVISIGVLTVLFAVLFKYLPDTRISWRDVGLGSFVTAVLFSVGKSGLGLYLGRSAVASSYGAAGSVLMFLLWVYYSSLILYFGAEFTRTVSDARRNVTA